MAVLLVTFDSNQEGQDYSGLAGLLKSYKHVLLSEGSYAVETEEATRTLYNKVVRFLNQNAHVYIITITKPFSSQCLNDVKNWLVSHLPQI